MFKIANIKVVSIPSFKTILDALDKNSTFHSTAKLFFSTLATESGRNYTIRKHFGIITEPVFSLLFEVISELFREYSKQETKTDEVLNMLDLISSVLAGLDQDPFKLDMGHKGSVFEMAKLLSDQQNVTIEIISNDKLHYDNDKGLTSITTDEWISKYLIS